MKTSLTGVACAIVLSSVASISNASLESRLDGKAFYDTELNVTWLADANLAASQSFGLLRNNYSSDAYNHVYFISTSGDLTWSSAHQWIGAMNKNNYLGFNDWRLPNMIDGGLPGCYDYSYNGTECGFNVDTATGELAHLFYDVLGNKAFYDASGAGPQAGWGLVNKGPFINLQSGQYWYDQEYGGPGGGLAWDFSFQTGDQRMDTYNGGGYALVLRTGDITPLSVPATAWLFGSGLLGLLGMARCKTS